MIFLMPNKVNFMYLLKTFSYLFYLDKDIIQYLSEKCLTTKESLQILVNDLLRKDIEIAKRVTL